jgi:hypothetical protein
MEPTATPAATGRVAVVDGHLSLDGQVWIPIFIINPDNSRLDELKAAGFNLTEPKKFSDPRSKIIDEDELARIRNAGMRYVFNVANPILYDEEHGIGPFTDADLEWVLPIINRYKDDPLLTFFMTDEPIGATRYWWLKGNVGIYYQRVVKLREWLHTHAPEIPLWVNHDPSFPSGGGGHSGGDWVRNTADITSLDLYPFRTGPTYHFDGIGHLRRLHQSLAMLKELASPSQPVFNYIQSWACSNDDFVRPMETRATALAGMLMGVQGYLFYSFSEAASPGYPGYTIPETFPENWAEIKKIREVASEAGPAIAAGESRQLEPQSEILGGGDDVRATLYMGRDGSAYLVVLNLSEIRSRDGVKITAPVWAAAPDHSLKAVSLFGGDALPLESGGFTRSFAPIQGDVYRIENAGL